jgi:hypothetical protein
MHLEMVIKFGGREAKKRPKGKKAAKALKKSLKSSSSLYAKRSLNPEANPTTSEFTTRYASVVER